MTETKCAPRLACEHGCRTVHMGEITRRNEVPCDSLQAALSPPLPAPQTGAFLVPPQTNQTKPSGLPEAHARPLPRVYLQKWPAFPSVQ